MAFKIHIGNDPSFELYLYSSRNEISCRRHISIILFSYTNSLTSLFSKSLSLSKSFPKICSFCRIFSSLRRKILSVLNLRYSILNCWSRILWSCCCIRFLARSLRSCVNSRCSSSCLLSSSLIKLLFSLDININNFNHSWKRKIYNYFVF